MSPWVILWGSWAYQGATLLQFINVKNVFHVENCIGKQQVERNLYM